MTIDEKYSCIRMKSTNVINNNTENAKAVQSFKEVLRGSKRDSVHLTLNAFLHRKFSSLYIMVPGGPKG